MTYKTYTDSIKEFHSEIKESFTKLLDIRGSEDAEQRLIRGADVHIDNSAAISHDDDGCRTAENLHLRIIVECRTADPNMLRILLNTFYAGANKWDVTIVPVSEDKDVDNELLLKFGYSNHWADYADNKDGRITTGHIEPEVQFDDFTTEIRYKLARLKVETEHLTQAAH